MKHPILSLKEISLELNSRRVLNRISLEVEAGNTTALLGRSGSGKSMTAHALMQLLPSSLSYKLSGQAIYMGKDLFQLTQKEMQQVRGKEIGMVFQEALHALDPLMKIGKQIKECLPKIHRTKEEVYRRMLAVGIADPHKRYHQYPHEFSGGMRQRVMIAMALAGNPKLLIADEPTTALDVTIQAQILQLITSLQLKQQLAILLITHDLSVVAEFSDSVYIIDQGEIVESGNTEMVLENPQHPFTKQLLEASQLGMALR